MNLADFGEFLNSVDLALGMCFITFKEMYISFEQNGGVPFDVVFVFHGRFALLIHVTPCIANTMLFPRFEAHPAEFV